MARTKKKGELFSHLTEVGYMREASGTHGDSFLAGTDAAKGDTSLSMQAITNFPNQGYILVGTGEDMEIAQIASAPSGSTIALKNALARNHYVGDTSGIVKQVTRTALGDITDDGVSASLSEAEFNAITAATKRGHVGYLLGHVGQMIEFAVEHFNLENLAAALGIPETSISGSGSSASPSKLAVLPDDIGTAVDAAWYFTGVRKDGTNVEVQAWGVEVDPGGIQSVKLARGAVAPIGFRLRPTGGICVLTWT